MVSGQPSLRTTRDVLMAVTTVILNPAGISALMHGPQMHAYLETKMNMIAEDINHNPRSGIDTILRRVPETNRPRAEGSVVSGQTSLVGFVHWEKNAKFGEYLDQKAVKEPDKLVGPAMLAAGFEKV